MLRAHIPEGPFRALCEYARIDASDRVVARHDVTTWSVEDELGVGVFAVLDGALTSLSVSLWTGPGWRVTDRRAVVIGSLVDVDASDVDALARVTAALSRAAELASEAASKRARAAEHRLDAIAGARDAHPSDPAVARAQAVLVERIRRFDLDEDAAMLDVLMRLDSVFEAACASLGERAPPVVTLHAALSACALAGRLRAFDRSLGDDDTTGADDGTPTPGALSVLADDLLRTLRDLRTSLASLERDLLAEAERQEWSDARLNAIRFRRAAAQIAICGGHLDVGIGAA